MRFCHHGSSGLLSVPGPPILGSLSLQPFPLPPSRSRPAALGAPQAARRAPLALGPVPPTAVPSSSGRPRRPPSTPQPASIPAVSAPSSQRLEVGTSPCALREAMSRGPGPRPEPRLGAEQSEVAPAPPGRLRSVARHAQACRHPDTGSAPAPPRDRSLRWEERRALGLARRRAKPREKAQGALQGELHAKYRAWRS